MSLTAARPPVVASVRRLWETHPPLFVFAALTALLGLLFFGGIFLDPRYVTGAPVWLKPLKFSISIVVYSVTLLWLLGFVEGRPRLVRLLAWLVLGAFALEWLAIITQAARGTTSHFNVSSTFNGALWSLMGGAILVLWLAHAGVTLLLLRQKFERPAFALALRLGLVIAAVGLAEGALMTAPSAQQLANFQGIAGAHSVGVPDGGPGLPMLGWSTRGGDLRVGHFIGMHALQALPLLGLLLLRARRFSERQKVRLVWIGAAFYLGVVGLVTWQALRAQPLIAPDGLTLGVLAALVIGAGLSAAAVLRPRALVSAEG